MKGRFLYLVAAFLIAVSAGSYGQGFKAGAAYRVITPDPLLPVSGGVGKPNPVTERKGDLFARALVLQNGTTTIAIVSLDNLGWPDVLGKRQKQ